MKSLINVSTFILEDFLGNTTNSWSNYSFHLSLTRTASLVNFVFKISPQEKVICHRAWDLESKEANYVKIPNQSKDMVFLHAISFLMQGIRAKELHLAEKFYFVVVTVAPEGNNYCPKSKYCLHSHFVRKCNKIQSLK